MPKGIARASFTCPHCGKEGMPGGMRTHIRFAHETDQAEKFWKKVNKTESCWLWTGCVNTTGYGMVNWAGEKNIVAHRLAWKLTRGPIPKGLYALHKCDTPRCCNPDHIFLGTQKDNGADCRAKGRTTKGITPDKMTAEKVRELRCLKAAGAKNIELASRYGISANSIALIATGKTWKNA